MLEGTDRADAPARVREVKEFGQVARHRRGRRTMGPARSWWALPPRVRRHTPRTASTSRVSARPRTNHHAIAHYVGSQRPRRWYGAATREELPQEVSLADTDPDAWRSLRLDRLTGPRDPRAEGVQPPLNLW